MSDRYKAYISNYQEGFNKNLTVSKKYLIFIY